MLPEKHRLSLRTEFKRIKKEGKFFPGKLFSLLLSYKQPTQPSRFAFLISTKVHKKATKRNRAKRLIGEAIYRLLPKILPGFDGVVLAKREIVDADFKRVKNEIKTIFKKAGLIKD